jgi:hypothetical protein
MANEKLSRLRSSKGQREYVAYCMTCIDVVAKDLERKKELYTQMFGRPDEEDPRPPYFESLGAYVAHLHALPAEAPATPVA